MPRYVTLIGGLVFTVTGLLLMLRAWVRAQRDRTDRKSKKRRIAKIKATLGIRPDDDHPRNKSPRQ